MKLFFSFFVTLLLCLSASAQDLRLPTYKLGEKINDTIYSYYGSLPSSGIGEIYFAGILHSELMPGVFFKIVIDSINYGDSPVNPAVKIIDDQSTSLNKRDTVELPAKIRLYAGKIGFHILIHGTPQTLGQEYVCDLGFSYTTGEDWGMRISENSNTICRVDVATGLKNKTQNPSFSVYPNPSTNEININVSKEMIGYGYSISNAIGNVLISGKINNERLFVSVNELLPGVYYVMIENTAPVKIIKQ